MTRSALWLVPLLVWASACAAPPVTVRGRRCEMTASESLGRHRTTLLLRCAEDLVEPVATDLAVAPAANVPFRILPSASAGAEPTCLATTYLAEDGSAFIVMEMLATQTLGLFQGVFAHELTHYYLRDFHLPHVVEEGMARHVEQKYLPGGWAAYGWADELEHDWVQITPQLFQITALESFALPEEQGASFRLAGDKIVEQVGFAKLVALVHSGHALTYELLMGPE